MAGKKGKGDAKGQSRRASGPAQSSSVDELTRRLAQNELSIQEVLAHLCASPTVLDPIIYSFDSYLYIYISCQELAVLHAMYTPALCFLAFY